VGASCGLASSLQQRRPPIAVSIRQLQERQALVLAENGKPIIARLARCIDGKAGRRLLASQHQLRAGLAEISLAVPTAAERAPAALAEARHCGIAAEQESHL
jgi:type IV secretion system protein VirD4